MQIGKFNRVVAVAGFIAVIAGANFATNAWRFNMERDADLDFERPISNLNSNQSREAGSGSQPLSPIPVRTFVVGSSIQPYAEPAFTGVIGARRELSVAFQVGGKITRRHVEVGETVRKGQLLFELDPKDFVLQHKTAQANLIVAEAVVHQAVAEEQRLRELRRANAVSGSDYERALSARDIAIGQRQSVREQLQLATNQLEYCQLKVDESGVILSLDAESSQVVTPGTQVCSIALSHELDVIIDIPENRIPSIAELTPRVQYWSMPGLSTEAVFREISPIADPATRTYRTKLSLLNPHSDVKLGMTAVVHWSNVKSSSNIQIPASSVFSRGDKPFVWLMDVEQGSISPASIQIRRFSDDFIEVEKGLSIGQIIVSAGVQKLDSSMPVRVWESPN